MSATTAADQHDTRERRHLRERLADRLAPAVGAAALGVLELVGDLVGGDPERGDARLRPDERRQPQHAPPGSPTARLTSALSWTSAVLQD